MAREVISVAESLTFTYAPNRGVRPLESVDRFNPRPRLRRWVAGDTATGDGNGWKESSVSIHHDGSVTVASAVGAHGTGHATFNEGWQVRSSASRTERPHATRSKARRRNSGGYGLGTSSGLLQAATEP